MAWNGSGTYTRTNGTNSGATVWADDAADGTAITAANHDTHDEDIATAINACLTKNNETKPSATFLPDTDGSLHLGNASLRWGRLRLASDIILSEQSDHGVAPAAAAGQLWVKDDAPCTLQFTDDTGVDHRLNGAVLTETSTGSGSSHTITGIPAWATKVVLSVDNVGVANALATITIQIGPSGGVETSGYVGTTSYLTNAGQGTSTAGTSSWNIIDSDLASSSARWCGHVILTKDSSAHNWVISSQLSDNDADTIGFCNGRTDLDGDLERIAIATSVGDFNNGSIGMTYY